MEMRHISAGRGVSLNVKSPQTTAPQQVMKWPWRWVHTLYAGHMERIVVTGIGAVTPVGLTARETWESLLAGQSGVVQ